MLVSAVSAATLLMKADCARLVLIFVTASIMLAIADGLGAIVGHPCTTIFLPVALVITFLGSSIPSLGRITWIAYLGVAFITAAGMHYYSVILSESN